MPFSLTVRVDILRSETSADIATAAGTYIQLGIPFAHRMRMVKITNNTDGDMFLAFTNGSVPASDGTADNNFVPMGGFTLFDFTSNSETSGSPFVFEIGTQAWVRESSTPTTGSVYLECIFGKGE